MIGLSRVSSDPVIPTCLGSRSLALDEAPSITAALQHRPSPDESSAWFWRQAAHDAEQRWLKCRHAAELGAQIHVDLKREKDEAEQRAAEASSLSNSLRAELSEGGARYADLLHLASQVDDEIANRRAAEDKAAIAEENESRTAHRCKIAEAQVAELASQISQLKASFDALQDECAEKRKAELDLQQRLDEILPVHARVGLELHTASERIELLEQCLRSSEAKVQSLQGECQRLELANSQLRRSSKEEHHLHSLNADHLKVALEECQALRAELKERGQHASFLQTEIDTLQEHLRHVEDLLQIAEAERQRWKDFAAAANKELLEGECKAVSTFFGKFPASAALVMVFRRLVELQCPKESLQEALQSRMNLHRPTHISRHELEYFLVECLGLESSDASTVGQVLFTVLDLERQGVLDTHQLYQRIVEPPSMRVIWCTDLEEIWPERLNAVVNENGETVPKRRGSSVIKAQSPLNMTPRWSRTSSKGSTPNRASSKRSVGSVISNRGVSRTPPRRSSSIPTGALPPVSDRSKSSSMSPPSHVSWPTSSAAWPGQNQESQLDSSRRESATQKVSSDSSASRNRAQSAMA